MGIDNVRENRRKADQILRSDQAYSLASPTLIDKAKNFIGGMNQKYVQPMMTKYRDFYANPNEPYSLFSDKGKDELKFIGNKLLGGAEFAGDVLQLPFEVAGQGMGMNVGSGTGFGDLSTLAAISNVPFNPYYDPIVENQYFEDMANINPLNTYSDENFYGDLFADRNFLNYLNTQKDMNIINQPYTIDQFYEDKIFPQVESLYTDDAFRQYLTDNELAYTEPNLLKYEDYLANLESDMMFDQFVLPYGDFQAELNMPRFLDQYNISEGFLDGDIDFGIFNDMMGDAYNPLEYETASGQNLFNDPMMSVIGDIPGYAVPFYTLRQASKIAPKGLRFGINQMYPGTTNTGIGFPMRLKNRPEVTGFRVPFSSAPRSLVQMGLLGEASEYLDD